MDLASSLYTENSKIILAVSGGIDSMVMLDLLCKSKLNIVVAHCNFTLRKESKDEELFVKATCDKLSIPFHSRSFNTEKEAKKMGSSIQETARKLRYKWFEELRNKLGFDLIATAHHLNDNIETVLYNLVKGTGIKGLKGIPMKNKHVIRPMLKLSRAEIENYANQNSIKWIEDSSNSVDKYSRNLLRLNVINELKKINPSLEKTFTEHFSRFENLDFFNKSAQQRLEKDLVRIIGNEQHLHSRKLAKLVGKETFLFNWLSPKGFTLDQINNISKSLLTDESGKQFLSKTYRLIKDRFHLLLVSLDEDYSSKIVIEKIPSKVMLGNRKLHFYTKPITKTSINKSLSRAYFDLDKIQFPMVLRRWKEGDYFYPFGLYSDKGKAKKKKLSKFFKDQKLSLIEKEKAWVLESNRKILWIVNHRTDDRYKVTESTKNILELNLV